MGYFEWEGCAEGEDAVWAQESAGRWRIGPSRAVETGRRAATRSRVRERFDHEKEKSQGVRAGGIGACRFEAVAGCGTLRRRREGYGHIEYN